MVHILVLVNDLFSGMILSVRLFVNLNLKVCNNVGPSSKLMPQISQLSANVATAGPVRYINCIMLC